LAEAGGSEGSVVEGLADGGFGAYYSDSVLGAGDGGVEEFSGEEAGFFAW
jgi:hypothetical protein